MRKILLLAFFVFASQLRSHESIDEVTWTHYANTFDALYARAMKDIFISNNDLKALDESDKAFLLVGEQKIAFRRSAVLSVLSDMLRLRDLEARQLCAQSGQTEICNPSASQKSRSKFLDKLKSWASGPFELFKDLLKDPAAFLLAPSVRLTREYGALTFATIVLSQVSWELLESVVSLAVGAGGAHLYCVVFNVALMSFVKGANSSLSLATSFNFKVPFLKRLKYVAQNFFWGIKYPRQIAAGFLLMNGSKPFYIRKKDFYKHTKSTDDPLSTMLAHEGLFAAEALNAWSADSMPNFEKTRWNEDWLSISKAESLQEKWALWNVHISGLELMARILISAADKKREDEKWPLKDYFKFHSRIGAWLKRVKDFKQAGFERLYDEKRSHSFEDWKELSKIEIEVFESISKLRADLDVKEAPSSCASALE